MADWAGLVARLLREGDDGERVHRPEDVRHVLPLLVFELGIPVASLSAGMQQLVADTAEKAGVREADGPEAAFAALRAWYEANPPDRAVLREIEDALAPSASTIDDATRRAIGADGPRTVATPVKGALTSTLARVQNLTRTKPD